ncbi:Ig-like domain-containing domain [Algoriphagus halophytocola]|uniref:Ig-like domain-containing domain n=1 Tax=Algoriphagus halophytocola TaxID=2991499 RepID=A0ABY6MDV4_9BACT|nr:Ig-like domain-containing domain [Algoriphagus sp. TR-M5]UZD21559.1 Ig-like domain-containing domain [Algoriphagus sp. TR-M5]
MGGPRDEDPPVVMEMNPIDQSLNSKPEEISIVFDEYIKLDNANKNILITPRVNKDEVIFTAIKNVLKIELNQDLEENTTYVFNFQKAVQDLSEGNPAENLKLVFSTGPSIDSLQVSGNVSSYFPGRNTKDEDILVGLYPLEDTTNVFTAAPYYLSQTDSIGNFNISNIKEGKYLAYAWKDDNNSLKAEYKSEAFDFITDTISIDQNIAGLQFNLSKGDQTPIKLTRSSPLGTNYTIVFNKNPAEITLENEQIGKSVFYSKGDKRINLYSESIKEDSIAINLAVLDSVGYSIDTLIYAKFEESSRNPDKLTITPNSGLSFYQQMNAELTFNKPVKDIFFDSLYLAYDTASIIPITPQMLSWKDSLTRDVLNIKLEVADSIPFEIFTLKAADSTFRDIEGQYNEAALAANYKKITRETLADAISGSIAGAEPPFIIQLLDSKGNLKKETYLDNSTTFSFKLIEAGNYQIRVIEDLNGNRRWDPANFERKKHAERTFYLLNPETGDKNITIRGGWTLEEQVIQGSPKTGLNTP